MEPFTPLVITSKKARKEFERVKAHALEIVKNHKDHVARVSAYHEKLRAEKEQKIRERYERTNGIK